MYGPKGVEQPQDLHLPLLRWMWGGAGRVSIWRRGMRVCVALHVRPLWGRRVSRPTVRRFASLTRGYRVVSPPLGPPASPLFRQLSVCRRRVCAGSVGLVLWWRPDEFLTRRMRFFSAYTPMAVNARKRETLDNEASACVTLLNGCPKLRFLPRYVIFRGRFPHENIPWNEKSIPWVAKSMGRIL